MSSQRNRTRLIETFSYKKGFVFPNKRNWRTKNERVRRTIESLPQIRSFADTLLIVSAEFQSYFPLVAPTDNKKTGRRTTPRTMDHSPLNIPRFVFSVRSRIRVDPVVTRVSTMTDLIFGGQERKREREVFEIDDRSARKLGFVAK